MSASPEPFGITAIRVEEGSSAMRRNSRKGSAFRAWVRGDPGGVVMGGGGEHTGEPPGRLEVLVLMEIKGQAEPLSTATPVP